MTRLFSVLMLSLLVGCGSFSMVTKKPEPPVATRTDTIRVDPRVLEPCADLQEHPINSPDDFIIAIAKVTGPYKTCKSKNDAAIKVIKDLINNK